MDLPLSEEQIVFSRQATCPPSLPKTAPLTLAPKDSSAIRYSIRQAPRPPPPPPTPAAPPAQNEGQPNTWAQQTKRRRDLAPLRGLSRRFSVRRGGEPSSDRLSKRHRSTAAGSAAAAAHHLHLHPA